MLQDVILSCHRIVLSPLIVICLLITVVFAAPGYCLTEKTKESPTELVLIGLHVDRISEVNDSAKSFTAEFDIWLRFRGAFDSSNLQLLNTAKPIILNAPSEVADSNGEHFRRFHFNTTIPFETKREDLLENVRRLPIQLSRLNYKDVHFPLVLDLEGMGLDKAEASWDQTLRNENVLSADSGWTIQAAGLMSVSSNEIQHFMTKPKSVLIASMTVQKAVVSPKAIIALLLPLKFENNLALEALLIVTALIVGTGFPLIIKRLSHRIILLVRLLLATLGFYFF